MLQNNYIFCIALAIQLITMPSHTMTLNVRITKTQYERLDILMSRGQYTSKSEFIRELLRRELDDFSVFIHEKARLDQDKHIPLEEFGKEWELEG